MDDDTGIANSSAAIPSACEHLNPSILIIPKVPDPWTLDKAQAAIPDKSFEESNSPVPFFHILELLKTTKREGWKRFGINRGESVADHSFRMGLMTLFAPPSLDSNRCMKMALVHDLAESVVGDITPLDKVPKAEKNRREVETMEFFKSRLLGKVSDGTVGGELYDLWQEFEEGSTQESKYVQDIDKVELLLQMMEYEKRGGGRINLREFTYVVTKLHLQCSKIWAEEILNEREKFWKGKGLSPGDETSVSMKRMQDQYYEGTNALDGSDG